MRLTRLAVPEAVGTALSGTLATLGLSEGDHVLVDNLGPALSRRPEVETCDRVILERAWAQSEGLSGDTRVSTRQGSALSCTFPLGAFNLALTALDPRDPWTSLEHVANATAMGGIIIAIAPTSLVDDDLEQRDDRGASLGLRSIGVSRFGVADERGEHAYDLLALTPCADGDQPIMPSVTARDVIGTMTRGEDGTAMVTGPGIQETAEALGRRLGEQVEAYLSGRTISEVSTPSSPAVALAGPQGDLAFDYAIDVNGGVWLVDANGVANDVATPGTQKARRLASAIAVVHEVERALSIEADPASSEADVDLAIRRTRERYSQHVSVYGRIVDSGAMRDFSPLTKVGSVVAQLEVTDAHGHFQREGIVLSERVAWPEDEGPLHVDDPDTALSVSLARTGRVDLDIISTLLDMTVPEALEALGDRVVIDPDDGTPLCASDYLSGNLGTKLDHVRALIAEQTTDRDADAASAWRSRMGISALESPTSYLVVRRFEEYSRTDAWRVLTGASAEQAVFARESLARHPYDNVDFCRHVLVEAAKEAAPGAWDPVLAASAREAIMYVIALATVPYRPYGHAIEAFAALALSPAVDEELVAMMARRLASADDGCRRELAQMVGACGDRAPSAPQDLATAAAHLVMERPEAAEWAVWRHHGHDNEWEITSRESFEAFCARRAEALEVAYDDERVAQLSAVEARLVAALPAAVERKDISAHLGSPWIPASVYLDFVKERMVKEYASAAQLSHVSIARDEQLRSWDVKYADAVVSEAASERYSVDGSGANAASALRLLSNSMRGIPTVITRTVEEDDGRRRQVTDEELTLIAADKRATMESDFVEWLWSDPARAEAMVRRYNETMNRHVGRSYDGRYLTLPGSSPEVVLRRHQLDAVARVLRSPEGTLLAHAVGAGKTYEGIAAAHEARRLGKCSKPLVAVPNSVVSQWAREWARFYPNDRVLVMDERTTRNPASRERFWDAARSGAWDAVIVPQSQFDQVGLSPALRGRAIADRIRECRRAIASSRGPYSTRRRREMALNAEIESLTREQRGLADLKGPHFDEIGFDMLVVDEAHRYKHLGVSTAMSVAGIDTKPSKMSQNLMRLCDYLRDVGKGSNIVFLTGTPVTNSVCELYVMQRYLAPRSLEQLGIDGFDAWAATFGEVRREVEIKPEGGLQTKDRFSRFSNLPELMASVKGWCDLVTNDDIEVTLPDVRVVNVEVPPTATQRQCMRWLEGRGEAIRSGRVPQTVDNMLLITGDGKKVALDPKLLFPDDPDVPPMDGGKVDSCVTNVLDVWRRTTTSPDGEDVMGVQLVFCDTSADNRPGWNVQADIKRRLVERGVPEDQIETVPGTLKPAQRDRLFMRARAGEVRVLIGSTQTLGTGVSVQERLAAIHDLDCPWRASDLDQRLGRIERQGNSFASCDWFQPVAYRYATVGTFDAYLYQTAARKGAFVSQVMTNDSPLREAAEVSDVVLTLSEMKALASGNPAVRRRLELDNEVKSLHYRRSAWSRELESARARLEGEVRPALQDLEAELVGVDELAVAVSAVRSEREPEQEGHCSWHGISVRGSYYGTDRESVGRANIALDAAIRGLRYCQDDTAIGKIGTIDLGVVWRASKHDELKTPRICISVNGGAKVATTSPAKFANEAIPHYAGPVEQALRLVDEAEGVIRRNRRAAERLRGEEEYLADRVATATWPLADELARKEAELQALPIESAQALTRAQRYPHISDVYEMLTTGNVTALGTDDRRTDGLGIIEVEDYEVMEAPARLAR